MSSDHDPSAIQKKRKNEEAEGQLEKERVPHSVIDKLPRLNLIRNDSEEYGDDLPRSAAGQQQQQQQRGRRHVHHQQEQQAGRGGGGGEEKKLKNLQQFPIPLPPPPPPASGIFDEVSSSPSSSSDSSLTNLVPPKQHHHRRHHAKEEVLEENSNSKKDAASRAENFSATVEPQQLAQKLQGLQQQQQQRQQQEPEQQKYQLNSSAPSSATGEIEAASPSSPTSSSSSSSALFSYLRRSSLTGVSADLDVDIANMPLELQQQLSQFSTIVKNASHIVVYHTEEADETALISAPSSFAPAQKAAASSVSQREDDEEEKRILEDFIQAEHYHGPQQHHHRHDPAEYRQQHQHRPDQALVHPEAFPPIFYFPAPMHTSLRELVKAGMVKHIITESTRGLLLRAGVPASSISEIKGNRFLEKCSACPCQYLRYYLTSPIPLHHLDHQEHEQQQQQQKNHAGHLTGRRCQACGADLLDSTIFFEAGEKIPSDVFEQAKANLKKSDLLLLLGSFADITVPYFSHLISSKEEQVIACHRTEIDVGNDNSSNGSCANQSPQSHSQQQHQQQQPLLLTFNSSGNSMVQRLMKQLGFEIPAFTFDLNLLIGIGPDRSTQKISMRRRPRYARFFIEIDPDQNDAARRDQIGQQEHDPNLSPAAAATTDADEKAGRTSANSRKTIFSNPTLKSLVRFVEAKFQGFSHESHKLEREPFEVNVNISNTLLVKLAFHLRFLPPLESSIVPEFAISHSPKEEHHKYFQRQHHDEALEAAAKGEGRPEQRQEEEPSKLEQELNEWLVAEKDFYFVKRVKLSYNSQSKEISIHQSDFENTSTISNNNPPQNKQQQTQPRQKEIISG